MLTLLANPRPAEADFGSVDESSRSDDEQLPLRLCSYPQADQHAKFFQNSLELILRKAIFAGCHRNSKVLHWKSPDELQQQIDFSLPLHGADERILFQLMEDIIQYSVKVGHPHFMNQLYTGVDPFGLVGQWLTDALNPSVYTYEVSPVFTIMEEYVLKEMRKLVGFSTGEGIFCPGGSMANGYGINCARHYLFPEIKKQGLYSVGRLVMFTSEDAHYSLAKMGAFMGLGSENVIGIKTDSRGKMLPSALEDAIKKVIAEGGKPFLVVATAGTTVVGAFDPIPPLARICSKYNLWLHVDAAWGGGCLMSARYRSLLSGIHLADSVAWNPHKLLAAPQQCSVLLTKHTGLLQAAHATHAGYLFQTDKFYDVTYDTGDRHVQCGRKADVAKFWFMWKAKGTQGFEKHINKIFALSDYFKNQIKNREGFQLVFPENECTNVCFWYIPPSLRNSRDESNFCEKLNKVAPKMKERMMKEGSLMITYQSLRKLPNFFRLVVGNSGLEQSDIDYVIETLERIGTEIDCEQDVHQN